MSNWIEHDKSVVVVCLLRSLHTASSVPWCTNCTLETNGVKITSKRRPCFVLRSQKDPSLLLRVSLGRLVRITHRSKKRPSFVLVLLMSNQQKNPATSSSLSLPLFDPLDSHIKASPKSDALSTLPLFLFYFSSVPSLLSLFFPLSSFFSLVLPTFFLITSTIPRPFPPLSKNTYFAFLPNCYSFFDHFAEYFLPWYLPSLYLYLILSSTATLFTSSLAILLSFFSYQKKKKSLPKRTIPFLWPAFQFLCLITLLLPLYQDLLYTLISF